LVFTESALSILERSSPIHPAVEAWARVAVEQTGEGESGETHWEDWKLRPTEASIESEIVPTTNRGYGAVIEATVVASRLSVDAYDTDELRECLHYFESVVETCGGEREREAMARIGELTAWNPE
ncbi:MAG TPA: DUF447 domain-containing protein, partial [Halococcus sp.]|nr:DUF447 domain-containing protein [Halococcus sp.]